MLFDKMLRTNALQDFGIEELNPRLALSIRRSWTTDFNQVHFIDYATNQDLAPPQVPQQPPAKPAPREPPQHQNSAQMGASMGIGGAGGRAMDQEPPPRGGRARVPAPEQQRDQQRGPAPDQWGQSSANDFGGPPFGSRGSGSVGGGDQRWGGRGSTSPQDLFGSDNSAVASRRSSRDAGAGPGDGPPWGHAAASLPNDHVADLRHQRNYETASGYPEQGRGMPPADHPSMGYPSHRMEPGVRMEQPPFGGPPEGPGRGYGHRPLEPTYDGRREEPGIPDGGGRGGFGAAEAQRHRGYGSPALDYRGGGGPSGRGYEQDFDDDDLECMHGGKGGGKGMRGGPLGPPPGPSARQQMPDQHAGPPLQHQGMWGGDMRGADPRRESNVGRGAAPSTYASEVAYEGRRASGQRAAQAAQEHWSGGLDELMPPRQRAPANVAQAYAEQARREREEAEAMQSMPPRHNPHAQGFPNSPHDAVSNHGSLREDGGQSDSGEPMVCEILVPNRPPPGRDAAHSSGGPSQRRSPPAMRGSRQPEQQQAAGPPVDSCWAGQSLGDCFAPKKPAPEDSAPGGAASGRSPQPSGAGSRGRPAPAASGSGSGQDAGKSATEIVTWVRSLPESHVPEKAREHIAAIVENEGMSEGGFTQFVKEVPPEICAPKNKMKLKAAWDNVLKEAAAREVALSNLANQPKQKATMIVV